MAHQRNRNFYVVRDGNGTTGQPFQDDSLREIEKEKRRNKGKYRRLILICAIATAVLLAVAAVVLYLKTYTKMRVSDTYKIGNMSNNNYIQFADGVLKYSRDGIVYLNSRGEEQWNQPYQIRTPFIDINGITAAVADKGGNDILVFQESGLKGEIKTTLPIEKIAVSEQGIVAAVLKNESNPRIICYDTAGNVLVEHKASLTGVGYPVDIALSPDGQLLQAAYLSVNSGEMTSRVCYYNFGEAGVSKTDHQVTEKEYKGSVIGFGFFMDESVSVAVGDSGFTIFKGKEEPKEAKAVPVSGEIQNVFYSGKYIGVILKASGSGKYEVCLYNSSGRRVLSRALDGEYKAAKISGGQVILYDGRKCSIFTRFGTRRFEGEFENNILEIFPAMGINKYIVMDTNGMEDVRLIK